MHLLLGSRVEGTLGPPSIYTLSGREIKKKWADLPLGPGKLARLTSNDPTQAQARTASSNPMDLWYEGPQFKWSAGLLYHQDGE